MTQEDKELLLKDLSARLPYGVKVEAKGLLKTIADDYDNRNIINAHVLNGLNLMDCFKTYSIDCMVKVPLFNRKGVCNIKPYLFPLSSITIEQEKELSKLGVSYGEYALHDDIRGLGIMVDEAYIFFEFCYKNHIDFLGLIEMGLAIDATGLDIY